MKNKFDTDLPVRVVLVFAAWLWADVGLLGGQLQGDALLEVDPGQVVLQVAVRVLGAGLELADGTDLHCVLPRVPGNS